MMKKNAFLLFEVLVAIVIASTMLIVIMRGMSNALKAENAVGNYIKAILLADTKMAMVEKDPACESKTESGEFPDELDPEGIFSWERNVSPIINAMWRGVELPVSEASVVIKWGGRELQFATFVSKDEEIELR